MLPARDGVLRRDRVELIPTVPEKRSSSSCGTRTPASASRPTASSTSASSATARTNLYKLAGAGTLR